MNESKPVFGDSAQDHPQTILCLHGKCGYASCFRKAEMQSGGSVGVTLADLTRPLSEPWNRE